MERRHPLVTAIRQYLTKAYTFVRPHLVWIHSKLSGVVIQLGLTVAMSIIIALAWPRLLVNDIATWHYFMSAVFQGLAALVSISLLAFFFLHERRDARIQALKNDCVEAAQQLSSSYPNYFDQSLLIEKLETIRLIMDKYERTYHRFKGTLPSDGEKPSKDEVKKAEEQWMSWIGPFRKAKDMLISLNRQKADAESLPMIVRAYVVPIFLPLMLSLLMLATSDYIAKSRVWYTATLLSVLLLTLLVIVRFGYGLSTGMKTQIAEDVPRGQEPENVIARMRNLEKPDRMPAFLIEYPPEW